MCESSSGAERPCLFHGLLCQDVHLFQIEILKPKQIQNNTIEHCCSPSCYNKTFACNCGKIRDVVKERLTYFNYYIFLLTTAIF